jgi:hypothetical protein
MMLVALGKRRKYMERLLLTVAIAGLMVDSAYANERIITHYRTAYGQKWVCHDIWGANYSNCSRITLAEVKKIDAFAEDTCRHGGEGVPHAQTGDAAILNYQCVNGRMTRDPYLNDFDADGYQSAQWKPIR